jgi:beta-lactam-binding protein with PASTA domain
MILSIMRYIVALLVLSALGLIAVEGFFIPMYVGVDADVFLPDCRGETKIIAEELLHGKGLETKVIILPYSNKNYPGRVIEMRPHPFTKVKKGRIITLSLAGHKKSIEVPDLRNITLRKAKLRLMEYEFNLDTVMYEFNPNIKNGYVSFQNPEKGTILKSGSNISLHISKGVPKDYFTIPDLVNLPLKKAKKFILQERLRLGSITEVYQPKLIPNTVIDQSYPPNLRVTAPVEIDLEISTDKK